MCYYILTAVSVLDQCVFDATVVHCSTRFYMRLRVQCACLGDAVGSIAVCAAWLR